MKKVQYIVYIFLISCAFSCQLINPSIMFQTGKDYKFATQTDSIVPEYKIAPNDRLTFNMATNEGYKLVDYTSSSSSGSNIVANTAAILEYTLDKDGFVKLPIVDKVNLVGKTVYEAETYLEGLYSEFYKEPFIKLKIVSKRAVVFRGEGGNGIVVPLNNDNTSVIEALALAGGISANGKAYRIKLIRGSFANPQIFLIDFSTVENMNSGNIILQANDIIYVEPVRNISTGILAQISPYIGILTATLLVYTLIKPK
ncbi:MAG: polysaccharide biosynthesis/export family protein [Bacteroidota bacterium]